MKILIREHRGHHAGLGRIRIDADGKVELNWDKIEAPDIRAMITTPIQNAEKSSATR